jgi:hypothetical protein
MNLRQEGQAAVSVAALQKMTTIKAKARRDPPGYRASHLPNRHRPEPPPLHAHQVPELAMAGLQVPAWAWTRPEATASASAAWSRLVWSA